MEDAPKSIGEWRTKAMKLEEELNSLREDYSEFKGRRGRNAEA